MAHRLQRRYLLRVRCGSGLAALISIVWLSACGRDDPASGSAPDGAAGTSNLDSGSAPDAQADVAIDVGGQEAATDSGADSPSSSLLFADDFERADTSSGLGNDWIVHVPGGSPPSTFGIEDGRAYPFFGEPQPAKPFHAMPTAFRPQSLAEQRVRVSIDLITTGGSYDGLALLLARSQTSTNELNDTYFCGFLAAAKKLYIMKLEGGVLDALAISGPDILPLPDASTSRLSFTLDGSKLSCDISGAVVHTLTATDDTYQSGYFGMAGAKPHQNRLRFDDFSIERL